MNKSLKIIVISGLPGSGKSTVAEGLSQTLKMPVFSVDPIESSVIKSGIKRSFETGLAAYLVAETLADEQLKHGISVIVDAVSPVKEARNMWKNLSKKYRAHLFVVECICSDSASHKNRIESRVRKIHGIPEVTWEDVEARRKEYLNWSEPRLVFDTCKHAKDEISEVLEYIEQNQ